MIYYIIFALSFSAIVFEMGLQSFVALYAIFMTIGFSSLIHSIIKHAFPLTEIDIGVNPSKIFRKVAWAVISLLIIPIILSIVL